jgi:hypothetical protein
MGLLFDLGGGANKDLMVQRKMCRTCPFRGNMILDPDKIVKQCANETIALCHCTPDKAGIACRGYYERAKETNTYLLMAKWSNQIKAVKMNQWGDDEFRLKFTMPHLNKTGWKRIQYWIQNFMAIIKGKMQI